MKIGEVSKRYGLPKDTLRYYMKIGLLLPQGDSRYSRYHFSNRDLQDLEWILHVKKQEFSLKEIMKLMTLRRTSNMVEPETIRVCMDLYANKKAELRKRIDKLELAIQSIQKDETKFLHLEHINTSSLGVPLKALEILSCPQCGNSFRLEQADLDAQYIYSGILRCSCGRTLTIENGIILTGNLYQGSHDWPDLKRGIYSEEGDQFVSCLQMALDKVEHELSEMSLQNKVIMETHINGFFFAYNHLNVIPDSCVYIVIDKFPAMLKEYKKLLESMGVEHNFLFIADDSMQFPIKKECVDLLVNCMSDNEYCLYNKGSYIADISPYLKKQAPVIGTFVAYRGLTESQRKLAEKYPESGKIPFSLEHFERQYENIGYKLQIKTEGILKETAPTNRYNFSCHVSGDPLHICFIRADMGQR